VTVASENSEKDMKWLKGPAIPYEQLLQSAGATAKTFIDGRLPQLRALLRQCLDVASLSLAGLDLDDMVGLYKLKSVYLYSLNKRLVSTLAAI
jgi:hypothetical protein